MLTPDVYTETDRPYTSYRVLYLSVDHDPDPPNPIDPEDNDGVWTVYSFDSRSGDCSNRDRFIEDLVTDDPDEDQTEILVLADDIRDKLKVGLAFFISRPYEDWKINTTVNPIFADLEDADGLMIWEHDPSDMGAQSYPDRQQDAQGELTEYNAWCNGYCWEYTLRDENGKLLTDPDVRNTLYGDYLREHVETQELQPYMTQHGLKEFVYDSPQDFNHLDRPLPHVLYVIVSGAGDYTFDIY